MERIINNLNRYVNLNRNFKDVKNRFLFLYPTDTPCKEAEFEVETFD